MQILLNYALIMYAVFLADIYPIIYIDKLSSFIVISSLQYITFKF